MNKFEELVQGTPVIIDDKAELPNKIKGLYIAVDSDKIILLNRNLRTINEKATILAEELGHHYTTEGNIIDQTQIQNRKQELKARRWAVKKLIRVEQFIEAFKAGVKNKAELAEFLDVTENFIDMAIDHYKGIYGYSHTIDNYTIYFSPLWVYKNLE